MGKMYIKKEKWPKALEYLKQATDLQEDPNKKADLFYLMAVVNFQQKKYSQARSNCYDVLKYRPNDGKAYILIGNMYAISAKSCGNNDLTTKVAYWAAVDKFIKAKNVDPSVADDAKKLINTYSQYFPATETIFFYDLKKGDKYKVECWINETTTVRTSD
jgi:tetratricopeptide (TPR) repeat protein